MTIQPRRSTWVLSVVFLLVLATYLLVRPAAAVVVPSGRQSVVNSPATSRPAPLHEPTVAPRHRRSVAPAPTQTELLPTDPPTRTATGGDAPVPTDPPTDPPTDLPTDASTAPPTDPPASTGVGTGVGPGAETPGFVPPTSSAQLPPTAQP